MTKPAKSERRDLEATILLMASLEDGTLLRQQDGCVETWRVEIDGKRWIAEVDRDYASATNIRPAPTD